MTSGAAEGIDSTASLTIIALICCAAVLSNTLVILVLALNKSFRGPTEVFLCNLAISDLLLAGIAIPLKLAQVGKQDFVGGNGACKIIMFTPMFTITSSISTMVAISFERYCCVVRQRPLIPIRALITVGCIWVLALVINAPHFYEYSVYEKHEFKDGKNETEIACGSHGIVEDFEMIYATIIVILSYMMPLVIIVTNYVNIGRFLYGLKKVSANNTSSGGAVNKNKLRIVKMLAIAALLFITLWAPFFVLFTMEEVTGTDDTSSADSLLSTVKQLCVALSTTSNPMIYALFNPKFRSAAKNVLCCAKTSVRITASSVTSRNTEKDKPSEKNTPAIAGNSLEVS